MSDNYPDVLLEDMNSKIDAMMEALVALRGEMAKQKDLEVVKSDVKIVKAAVTDLSHQVHDHESRIGSLEASR